MIQNDNRCMSRKNKSALNHRNSFKTTTPQSLNQYYELCVF